MQPLYADIILPLAVRGHFTYAVPGNFSDQIKPGMMVNVPFGRNRLYNGIVASVHSDKPLYRNIRSISGLVDNVPAINSHQLRLWSWISEYYMCSEGEVKKAAVPSAMALKGYKLKYETYIKLSGDPGEKGINSLLDSLKKAPRQQEMMLRFLDLTGYGTADMIPAIRKVDLLSFDNATQGTLDTLIKKEILKPFSREVSRIKPDNRIITSLKILSEPQKVAYDSIREDFKKRDIVLLHGVTSSGKTEIYIHLIEEQLRQGRQVLYMLPEIALTTRIIERLKNHFGEQTGVYHSRLSDQDRTEIS